MQPDPNLIALMARVRPLKAARLYEVQIDTEPHVHVVSRTPLGVAVAQTHCTCCDTDSETSAKSICETNAETEFEQAILCVHESAVAKYLSQRRHRAARRRERGLAYHGWRNVAPDPLASLSGTNRSEACVAVCRDGRWEELDAAPGQQLYNHSPDGFEWGYGGSGPAQLALSLLLDYTGDAEVALQFYQAFKAAHIAGRPRELNSTWKIGAHQIESFLQGHGWTGSKIYSCLLPHDAKDCLVVMSDEEVAFAGYYGGRARCRILLGGRAGESVVVAADLPQAPGTSVTNRVEAIAGLVCRRYDLDPRHLLFIQQHPAAAVQKEYFDLVTFRYGVAGLSEPRWIGLTRRQVEALLGQRLPDAEPVGSEPVGSKPVDASSEAATARPA